ncbi:MAG TPA: ATP-grasp domain-containing protein [Pirellulaceae bacterium]|nr:ATP-grasp domain-containing protein [Pirellulaceae bacterium]
MDHELILVGASVRAAAHSALRAGFQPYAIDQFADRDLTAICPAVKIRKYPYDLLPALGDAPQTPWMYTGGLENYPRLIDRMAEIRPLWGNSGNVLRRVRNPWLLAKTMREAGLEMPATVRELSDDHSPAPGSQWLVKPLRSSGGHKIKTASDGPQPRRPGFYYQEFIRGQVYGAVYLATSEGCQLLGVNQQIQMPGAFGYQGSIVMPDEWHRRVPDLMRLGTTLQVRFALRGLFNVDFVRNEAGDWPLEVNPRYSASVELLERATGVSFLRLHAAVFNPALNVSHHATTIAAPARALGKSVVYSQKGGTITVAMDQLVAEWNDGSTWPGIADVPRVGDPIHAGQPICTLFAEGETVAEVARQLQERSQRVLGSAIATASRV